ncbi:MAG: hypothetical protein HKN29_15445 [Rhodothermales bacterium]|nr:hypothetical protein [Rhodothermales bacterium]
MAITLFVASILGITSMVFYKTIITKEWRNKVPNESEHWRGFIFYHNPNDPRYFLPKRTGLGWTINLAHPGAIVMLILIAVAVVSFAMVFLTGT